MTLEEQLAAALEQSELPLVRACARFDAWVIARAARRMVTPYAKHLQLKDGAALADLRRWGELQRDYGGWWVVPGTVNGPNQHQGPHDAATIRRLVKRGLVVLVRDRTRALPMPEKRGER